MSGARLPISGYGKKDTETHPEVEVQEIPRCPARRRLLGLELGAVPSPARGTGALARGELLRSPQRTFAGPHADLDRTSDPRRQWRPLSPSRFSSVRTAKAQAFFRRRR